MHWLDSHSILPFGLPLQASSLGDAQLNAKTGQKKCIWTNSKFVNNLQMKFWPRKRKYQVLCQTDLKQIIGFWFEIEFNVKNVFYNERSKILWIDDFFPFVFAVTSYFLWNLIKTTHQCTGLIHTLFCHLGCHCKHPR